MICIHDCVNREMQWSEVSAEASIKKIDFDRQSCVRCSHRNHQSIKKLLEVRVRQRSFVYFFTHGITVTS